jgi:hypothetical protein
MTKGDEVADDKDDDAVRNSRSQDGQHDTFSSPTCVSHLPAGPQYGLQGFR